MAAAIRNTSSERPQFAFINITKPKDVTRADNQRTIRSHAWYAGRPKKRKRRLKYTFDLQVPPVLASPLTNSHQEETQLKAGGYESDKRHSLEYLPIDFLRPIGSGRDINPFSPFPIPSTERIVQLIDFGVFRFVPLIR